MKNVKTLIEEASKEVSVGVIVNRTAPLALEAGMNRLRLLVFLMVLGSDPLRAQVARPQDIPPDEVIGAAVVALLDSLKADAPPPYEVVLRLDNHGPGMADALVKSGLDRAVGFVDLEGLRVCPEDRPRIVGRCTFLRPTLAVSIMRAVYANRDEITMRYGIIGGDEDGDFTQRWEGSLVQDGDMRRWRVTALRMIGTS